MFIYKALRSAEKSSEKDGDLRITLMDQSDPEAIFRAVISPLIGFTNFILNVER